jgi:site-specific DNA recombinase
VKCDMAKNIALKVKARAYVRVSTLKESQKDSPEHQEAYICEMAAKDGISIEHVYLDRDTATTIIAREDVQKMVNDAKAGMFNTIYFVSLSRFSRDALDAISLKRILVNALGIRVISIEDNYDSGTNDDEMLFGIISTVNQKQSETISTSSKRGIRQSARKGNFTGSIAPYGYKKVVAEDGRKTLEIVPEHAEIVREIYDLYVNSGMGEKAITIFLNSPERTVPSPKKGEAWGITTVQRILQNENYTGYTVFSKLESKQVYEDISDLQNRRKKLTWRDKDEWEKTDFQTHEPIISVEMFNEAQRIRQIRGGGKRGGQRKLVNAFAKLIFCKHCGAAIVAMTSVRKNKRSEKRYTYLMCSKRRRQGEAGCKNNCWIPYEEFRDELIRLVVERMNRVVNLETFNNQFSENTEHLTQDLDKEIKRLEKITNDNRRLLFELRRQHMLNEIDDSQYTFEKEIYEKEISEVEAKKEALKGKIEQRRDLERLRKDVKSALAELNELKNYDDIDYLRIVMAKLIDRIEINVDGEADVYSVLGQI